MINVLTVLLGCVIISLVVFGGAQMFIPYFKILLVNFLHVPQSDWETVISIANATPGVFGLKVSLASGYLAEQGYWWGYLLMFGTYAICMIIPIGIMFMVMKKYQKIKQNSFMKVFLEVMKPTIAGILISIAINLGLSILVPFVGFNDLGSEFGQLDKYFYFQETFFTKWRFWALLCWSIFSIGIDWWLIHKYKINIGIMIIVNIILCMIIFEPWLI